MRNPVTCLLALLALCALSASARAQTLTKVVRLEVDEKEVARDYKVFLICEESEYEARQQGEGFVVPPEVKRCEHVNVRVVFGGYDLSFTKIHVSKFGTEWVIGVDKKPFSEQNLGDEEDAEQVKIIYYVHFLNGVGLDTQLIVKIK